MTLDYLLKDLEKMNSEAHIQREKEQMSEPTATECTKKILKFRGKMRAEGWKYASIHFGLGRYTLTEDKLRKSSAEVYAQIGYKEFKAVEIFQDGGGFELYVR